MTSPSHMQQVAEEAILDHFRNPEHEPFHSDDLWHVIPDEHRGVISLAVMALVNKKLITGCGYRKSAIPSRKRSPSQEYRLTELGRDRIAGVGAGKRDAPSRAVARSRPLANASTHSGDRSTAGVTTGVASPQGTQGSSSPGPDCASSDPGGGSSVHGRQPTHGAGEPRPLTLDIPPERPRSAITDAEAA